MQTWNEHFEITKNNPPSPWLEPAISLCKDRNHALDLGAGSLKDSKFLLSMGFKKVTAIDYDPSFKKFATRFPRSILELKVKKFEEIKRLPTEKYDLINASYSLPFTTPPRLPALLNQIIKSLKPDGIFCANFFGPKDSWTQDSKDFQLTFFDENTLKELLKDLKLIQFKPREWDGKTTSRESKHWHTFEVIAQKIN